VATGIQTTYTKASSFITYIHDQWNRDEIGIGLLNNYLHHPSAAACLKNTHDFRVLRRSYMGVDL